GDQRSLAVVAPVEMPGPVPVMGFVLAQVERAIAGQVTDVQPGRAEDEKPRQDSPAPDRGHQDLPVHHRAQGRLVVGIAGSVKRERQPRREREPRKTRKTRKEAKRVETGCFWCPRRAWAREGRCFRFSILCLSWSPSYFPPTEAGATCFSSVL